MSSAHFCLGFTNVFREGSVHSCKVADGYRVRIEQTDVAHAKACKLFDHCRPCTPTADDSHAEVTEDILNLTTEGTDVPVKLINVRRCPTKPVSNKSEPATGNPHAINVGMGVLRFDVTGEAQCISSSGDDYSPIYRAS